MIIAKANALNEEPNLNSACKFSTGCFYRFKDRDGNRQLSCKGEIKSADCNIAATFPASFASSLKEECITYNAFF